MSPPPIPTPLTNTHTHIQVHALHQKHLSGHKQQDFISSSQKDKGTIELKRSEICSGGRPFKDLKVNRKSLKSIRNLKENKGRQAGIDAIMPFSLSKRQAAEFGKKWKNRKKTLKKVNSYS